MNAVPVSLFHNTFEFLSLFSAGVGGIAKASVNSAVLSAANQDIYSSIKKINLSPLLHCNSFYHCSSHSIW